MLARRHLDLVASEICQVLEQLHREARRLERERRSIQEFSRTSPLPRVLPLSDQLKVHFIDRLYVKDCGTGDGSDNTPHVELEYDAIAEVRRIDDDRRLVAFHFTTTWPRLDVRVASPEARVRAQRALRTFDSVFLKIRMAWPSWAEQARATITKTALPVLEGRNRLAAALWPHQLRASPSIKAAQWRWRSGQTELGSHGLGPIVLSPTTTRDEVNLKMAFLVARHGTLDAQELGAILNALQRYLKISQERAREVFNRATMGYAGDMSPDSFRAYLRAVAWSVRTPSPRASRDEIGNDGDRETPRWAGGRRRSVGRAHAQRGRREYIRLPSEEAELHPWALGQPALLSRLAVDYEIEAHVVRSWWRVGKIRAVGCRRREERTASGRSINGTIEVPASERTVFETLYAKYLDKQVRRRRSRGGTPAEKKRLYRGAMHRGDGWEQAADVVRELARDAGLPDVRGDA